MDLLLILLAADYFTEFNTGREKYANTVWLALGLERNYSALSKHAVYHKLIQRCMSIIFQ